MKYILNNFKAYVFAALIAILISIALLFPALSSFNKSFVGDGGDNYEYAGYMMLFSRNLSQGKPPFEFTNFWRYPVGFDFERSFDSHLAVTIGGGINYFISSPLSYNLTVVVLMALNGLFSFVFFKYITGSKMLGVLGMIMYGFSFYTLAKAEAHLNLLFIGGFPLLAYSVLRIIKEPRIDMAKSFLFFFSLFIIALGSKEYFLLAVFFLGLYFVVTSIFYREVVISIFNKIKKSYKLIFASTAVFLSCLYFVFAPYLFAIINGQFYLSQRGGTLFDSTPSLIDYVIPNGYLNLLSNVIKSHTRVSIESMVFIGWIELVLFVLFFFNRRIKTKFKLFILTIFLIPLILSFGYGKQDLFPLLPYRFINDFILFKAIAETNRYFVIFYLVLSCTVSLMLIPLKLNKKLFPAVVVAVIIMLLLERFPLKTMMVPTLNDKYTKVVRNQTSLGVLDLPVNVYHPDYDVLPFYYDKPIVNGYFHWASDGPKERAFLSSSGLMDFYCNGQNETSFNKDSLIQQLKAYGITTVVVHKNDNFYYTVCKSVRTKISSLLESPTLLDLAPVKEKQINLRYWEGNAKFTFYFPTDGTFYLDGAYISPANSSIFGITLNNRPLDNFAWSISNDYSMILLPKYTLSMPVKAGTEISFSTQQDSGNTYFSLWYRYVANPNPQVVPFNPGVQKLYEDDTTAVYRLE